MTDKLDGRYVEYDMEGAIGILPIANGGTGNNTVTANRVMVSSTDGSKLQSTNITLENLNKLQGYPNASATIHTRLANLEDDIHVPAASVSNQYLKSLAGNNPSWQTGLLPTSNPPGANYIFKSSSSSTGSWVTASSIGGGILSAPTAGTSYVALEPFHHGFTNDGVLLQQQRWSVPASGTVKFHMRVAGAVDSGDTLVKTGGNAQLKINGVAVSPLISSPSFPLDPSDWSAWWIADVAVNAGDIVSVWASLNSWGGSTGGSLQLYGYSGTPTAMMGKLYG